MSAPIVLADYGDGVLHRFGFYFKKHPLQVAACAGFSDRRPQALYLEHTAPEGASLCPYCEEERPWPASPRRYDGVPVATLRQAFDESGLTVSEVARRIGLLRQNGAVNDTPLRRQLGLAPSGYRNGVALWQKTVTPAKAAAIARALNLDPHEIGL